MPEASFVPKSVALRLYAGDGAALEITVTSPDGTPLTLDGQVTAQVRTNVTGGPTVDFDVQVANNVATLSLTGIQTETLQGFTGNWDCQWTPATGEPKTLVRGNVTCQRDVTA